MPELRIRNRVVIDTNLWISALLTGNFTKIERIVAKNDCDLLISTALLEELIVVAKRSKFRKYFELETLEQIITKINAIGTLIEVTSVIELCRDEKDNYLLSLGKDGNATHILTGDKDLLILHPFGKISIMLIADYFMAQKLTE